MRQTATQKWGRTLSLAALTVAFAAYLAVDPFDTRPGGTAPYTTAIVNVNVSNQADRVLTELTVTVGDHLWSIGPLPPGGDLPFHFAAKNNAAYTISGRYMEGTEMVKTVPYTAQGHDDLVTFTEDRLSIKRLR